MPPVIGHHPFHLAEMVQSQREFHLAFGRAFGARALIEERLSYWFHVASQLPSFDMARSTFFAPRVFQARTDLLIVALEHNATLCHCAKEFLKGAISKAGKLSSFRNSLAHGEQTFDAREDSPTFKQAILISGKRNAYEAANDAITVSHLDYATSNYQEVAKLLMDALDFVSAPPSGTQPEECLRQLNQLPNRAEIPRTGHIP